MTPVEPVPLVTVRVDGTPLDADARTGLSSVRVVERLSYPTECELVFALSWSDDEMVPVGPGADLRVSLEPESEALFAGQVTAVETAFLPSQAKEIRVRAHDRLWKLQRRRQVQSFIRMTPIDLARELAQSVGLAMGSIAHKGPLHQRIVQHGRSDFDLLAEELASVGMYVTVHEHRLEVVTLEGRGPEATLRLGESLLEARFDVDSTSVCRAVTVSAWEPFDVRDFTQRATRTRAGPTAKASTSRDEAVDLVIADAGSSSASVAEAAAQAELDRRVASAVVFRGTAQGDVTLRPGQRVHVGGVGPQLEGVYVLSEVAHTIDARAGYVSRLSTAPPPSAPRRAEGGATLGVVSAVGDPERRGRVQVTFPTIDGQSTDWIPVVTLGAGPGKGLMVVPEVGDRVLVQLLGDDPARAVVLGGLFERGSQPPHPGFEDGRQARYTLRTRGGQQVQLDEAADIVRLENAAGSFVELSPAKVSVHAMADLDLEAPGRAIVIRGESIDFRKG